MKILSRISAVAPAAALLALTATGAAAQVAPTPRALGMGGAYVATARGHETLFLNPANLALPGTPYWSISIPQLSVGGGTVGPTLTETWDIVQASSRAPERRAEVLARVPADGMAVDLDLRAPLAAYQSRRFVVGVAYGAVADHTLDRDLIELFVDGYQAGRTDYAVGNTTGSRATFFDFALGYGRRVGSLSIGATAHYIRGRTLSRTKLFEPVIDPAAETIEIEFREVLVRGGKGYGLDLGAAYQPTRNLTLSAVIANAMGRMAWSEDLLTRSMLVTQADFGASSMHWEERLTQFRRDDGPLDPSSAPPSALETAHGLYDRADFPATLRTGASYHLPGSRTHFEAGYQHRLSDGRLGGAWERIASVGVQQRIPLITLRAGAASNLDGGSLVSGGVTLGAMELGLARLRDGSDVDPGRTGWIGSVGLNIGTRTLMP